MRKRVASVHAPLGGLEEAKERCLRLLSYRPRSEAELSRYLRQRGFSDDIITETMERLRTLGLVDDTQFARAWVESRLRHRPMGRSALRWELLGKGLTRDLTAQVLQEQISPETEFEAALRLTRKRIPHSQGADDPRWPRLIRLLRGRGFSQETIRQVVGRLISSDGDNNGGEHNASAGE